MRRVLPLFLAAALAACASTREEEAVSAMREAIAATESGDIEAASEHAERALELRPGFVDPLMLLASMAERQGNLEEARRRYAEVLRVDPTDTSAGVALGFTYAREGRFDEARDWFAKAIEADPGCEPAAYNLGSVCEQLQDLETAAAWFDVAAALDRRDPRALVRIAGIRLAQGRPEDALAAADAALLRYPRSQSGQAARARALAALGSE